MFFAHCLAFEALLGCFYMEKKSVALAKHFLMHSLCLSLLSCFPTRWGSAQTGSFPIQKLESAFGASAVSCPSPGHGQALPVDLPGGSSTSPRPLFFKQVI